MTSTKSSVFRPNETEEDTHPHACYEGVVYLGYIIEDSEAGEEVEVIEAVRCRRCAEAS